MKTTEGASGRRSEPLRLSMCLSSPDSGAYQAWMRNSERPIAIDLFSGAGGLSCGLESAGYRVALAVDIDTWALETHAHNFAGSALCLDLGRRDVRDSIVSLFDGIDVALVAGGPPCQPYSRAGRSKIRSLVEKGARESQDHRREMWQAFIDIVERIKPRAVLMENVPDMALSDDGEVLRLIISRLEKAGYEADAQIVDTWLYGVPQHRQRLVVVGLRGGRRWSWPAPVGQVTLREAISDLPVLDPRGDEVGATILNYDGPKSDFQRLARKNCNGENAGLIFDHVTRPVRADDLEAFRLMKPGSLYSDLPVKLRRYRADIFDDKYNRLDWESFSRSITAHIAKDGYWYIHPDQHRTITVREAARIQTFPDHFRFAGYRSHQFAQIGNAVPPALAESIGSALLEQSKQRKAHRTKLLSFRRRTFRNLIMKWAEVDRRKTPWAYPGDPWSVVVGLILDREGAVQNPSPADILTMMPAWERVTPGRLAAVERDAGEGSNRAAIERLRRVAELVQNDSLGWDGTAWRLSSELGPAQKKWLESLSFEKSILVPSSSVLRVTARITGTDVDKRKRMSTGRIELAKLVGIGPDGVIVNAAMHRLGNQVCTNDKPLCAKCPVNEVCRSSQC